MCYRAEIDGLRAVALIPVILFHAGFEIFSGGFVGVDVFFVISGYLITSIILSEMDKGKFSLINFYERRARRILPALFLVMFACVPFAWMWLLPRDMKDFAQSLVAVSTFSSNILFWRESGYFAAAAELKPLLHTWSLGVEEQYYILFPLFLTLTWRLGKRWVLLSLVAVAVVSLGVAHWGSYSKPAATFYLLPTRGWELLVGSFAFYLYRKREPKDTMLISQLTSLLGLCLIGYAVFSFDRHTPFPSLYALAPTIGTALLILFAHEGTLANRILRNRALVGIGLISYSAYLWHQPLLAFAKYRSLSQPPSYLKAVLCFLAIPLAYLSWRYVENPFRRKTTVTRSFVFTAATCLAATFVAFGTYGHFANGFYKRFDEDQIALLKLGDRTHRDTMGVYSLRKCFIDYDQTVETLIQENCALSDTGGKKVFVFGDSEAAHLMAGVRKFFSEKGYAIAQWTATSCRSIDYAEHTARCSQMYRYFVDEVVPKLTEHDVVILSSRWVGAYKTIGHDRFVNALDQLFEKLKNVQNVVVVGKTPEFRMPPHVLMVKHNIKNIGTVRLFSEDITEVNSVLHDQTVHSGLTFFDSQALFCGSSGGLNCMVARDGIFYYFDRGHLSPEGSEFLVGHMIDSKGSSE